jgi:hypothetical protein
MFFKIANQLYRDKKYYEAALIYTYLTQQYPKFNTYKSSLISAFKSFENETGNKMPRPQRGEENDQTLLFKLFDCIINNIRAPNQWLENEMTLKLTGHPELPLIQASLLTAKKPEAWIRQLNNWYKNHELREAIFRPNFNQNILSQINFPENKLISNEKISIMMSCFNAGETIEYAINSILWQDYSNFELIIIDDGSTDMSASIIESYAQRDNRIKPFFNKQNKGTYYNRNLGLQAATGKYFTCMDADDLCHPERLSIQAGHLHQNNNTVANIVDWVRVDSNGSFVYKNSWGGGYQHLSFVSLLFNREIVINRLGYYDSVRFGADSEYKSRIEVVFGVGSIQHIRKPLLLGLSHEKSLTGNLVYGIDNLMGVSAPRREYSEAWKAWHSRERLLYLSANPKERPFQVPQTMLSNN